ncbi:MAG: right-handed parallel beta-helix repeat-containing protein, partial [Ginsengibacter sp.]
SMIVFDIKSDIPSNIVIAGIGFRSKKPSVVEGDGGSTARSTGISMIECVDFVIERCRFEYFGNAGISVRHDDTLARGLIRKNEFYYNAGDGLGYGVAVYGTDKQWITDPKFGTSNFIFIEDNVFDFHRHSVAAGGCALYVFRYNTVLNNTAASGGHAIDTHEARKNKGNIYGTRAVEVYNNKLLNTTYTDGTPIIPGEKMDLLETAGIAIRAGDAVVFNNEVKGFRYAARISNWFLNGTIQSTYPIPGAPGYLSGMALGPNHSGINSPEGDGDAFFWNNTSVPFVKGPNDTSSVFHNDHPDWWKEGRDYHLVPKPGYKPYPYPYPLKAETKTN